MHTDQLGYRGREFVDSVRTKKAESPQDRNSPPLPPPQYAFCITAQEKFLAMFLMDFVVADCSRGGDADGVGNVFVFVLTVCIIHVTLSHTHSCSLMDSECLSFRCLRAL
jgi:hypothetical protein